MKLHTIILVFFISVVNNVFASAQFPTDVTLIQNNASVNKTNPVPMQLIGSSTTGYRELIVTDNGLKVDTTIGSASVNVVNEPAMNITKIAGETLPFSAILAHPYVNCQSYATKTTTALTNYTLIDISSTENLHIMGVAVFNLSTTAGGVEFFLGSTLKSATAIGGSVGSGYISDVYWKGGLGEDLIITAVPPSLGITIYYIIK